YLYVNRALEAAIGLPREALIGKTHEELGLPAAQCAWWSQALGEVFRTGQAARWESGLPGFAAPRCFETCVLPHRASDGLVESLLTTSRDLTECQEGKERLRQLSDELAQRNAEQAGWKQVVEGIADEVWLSDAQGRMSLVNVPEVRHIGLEQFKDRLVEQVLEEIEILHPDGQLRLPEQSPLLRSLRGEIVRGQEIMRHRASGRTRWRQFSSAPIRDAAGAITGSVAIAWDITEHKQMEAALREAHDQLEARVLERTAQLQASHEALAESEERYRRLFQAVSDAVVVLDLETGAVVEVNDAALRQFGYSGEEFLRLKGSDLTAEPEESAAAFQGVLAGKLDRIPLRQYRRKDGTTFPVEISGSVFSVKGRQMLCSLIHDLSERRQLEQELLRISEREQQRIACDLHDGLGQQLVAIAFSANALHDRLAARQQPEAKAAEQISELLDGAITDARRLFRGLQPVRPDVEGLRQALEELSLTASNLLKMNCRFQCVEPVLLADNGVATHLFRIAQEAVTNAHKHGRAGQVLITLRQEHDRITLRVEDNGKGLPEEPVIHQGMGLRIMKHRAGIIGGSLHVGRAGTRGVLVSC
ncbi:MAG TPA: PAS domain S-box protein, partial [Candidatus Sulfotelmatobacter sp.]|nr:PAS domain S-box protein [Candidatus Sulfotelmatobacter sp.]